LGFAEYRERVGATRLRREFMRVEKEDEEGGVRI
jgi:hypothetical protein